MSSTDHTSVPQAAPNDMLPRIAASSGTAFEKRVWTLLCQIPAGQVTTYGRMAEFLGTSPRAVGNAVSRNPFILLVPCHRCVAADGSLGGFKGVGPRTADAEGGPEHDTLAEKRSILRSEGVRFNEKGRVLGTPFHAFR